MNILSLFDGVSCGRLALERAGIKIDNYYASEIDRYAISITQANHPDTIQLGDVRNWREWDLPQIDIILGGSPCQGFSMAGTMLNFDDPRSKLFFEFVDILEHYKPKYFLLENVKMKREWVGVISSYLGVQPIEINSSLVSAQLRPRLYWTNIGGVGQPEDRGIFLEDITLSDNHLALTDKALEYMNRKVKDGRTHWDFKLHSDVKDGKASCVTANAYKGVPYNVLIDKDCIRYFHPVECERLQTLPDNYTQYGADGKEISKTQRYKAIGNGWTVDVVAHILGYIKSGKVAPKQLKIGG